MKYFKKDEEFLKQRRLFLRNAGLLLTTFGFAPDVKLDLLKKLTFKMGFNTAFAADSTNAPKFVIHIGIRAGCNFKKYVQLGACISENRPLGSYVWAGNREELSPVAAQNAVPRLSPTTNNWFADGEVYNNMKDVPLAFVSADRGQNGHTAFHSVTLGVGNQNNEQPDDGFPAQTVLHAATTPRLGIIPGPVTWNVNGANIGTNIATNRLLSAGYQVPVFTRVNDPLTYNSANAFINTFAANLRLDGFDQTQKAAVATAVNDFSRYGLNQRQLANANQVLGATKSISTLLTTDFAAALALTADEVTAWDANPITLSGVGGSVQQNLGLALATVYKAAKLGLAQEFVIQINETDMHTNEVPTPGWQNIHMTQGINFSRIIKQFYQSASSDPSPFGSGKTMWQELLLTSTSEWGRSLITQGANDDGDAEFIAMGGGIKSGTYFDATDDFSQVRYASDFQTGGPLEVGTQNRLTSPQAWRMLAIAAVGEQTAQKFGTSPQLAPSGQPARYILKN